MPSTRYEVINKYFTEKEKEELFACLLKQLISIRVYWKGNLVMCDVGDTKNGNGASFFIPETYTKAFFYRKKFYMYLRRWYNEEERQQYLNARKLAEASPRENKGTEDKWERK